MSQNREKMIERIRNLRAKAADAAASEAEAQAAAEAAAKLLAKLDLSEADLAEDDRDQIVTAETDMQDVYDLVAGCIGRLTETHPVVVTRDFEDQRQRMLSFTGEPADVEMALYLSEIVRGAANRGWMQAYMDRPKRGRCKPIDLDTFKRGFWQGLGERVPYRINELADQRREARQTHGTNAVVVSKRGRINAHLAENFPGMHKRAVRNLGGGQDGYTAGRAAGDKVGLGRPIKTGSTGPAMIGAS